MSDAEKLSRPFVRAVRGRRRGAIGRRAEERLRAQHRVEHEVIYLRKPRLRLLPRVGRFIFDVLLRGSAVAVSPLGKEPLIPTGLGTAPVSMSTGGFVVANTNDMQLHDDDGLPQGSGGGRRQ